MTQPVVNTTVNKYKVPKGNVFFNQLSSGVYQGFRALGNCPEFDITIATDTLTHVNSQGGLSVEDLNVPKSITRTAKITCDNLSNDNLLLFLSANSTPISQVATPVTNYNIPAAVGNRTYQLGAAGGNPAGVRGVGSVAVRITQGDTGSVVTRANTTAYTKGQFLIPATPNSHYYVVSVAGTSGGSIPTYPTDGSTVSDGSATLKDMGLIIVPSTAGVNYILDTTLGLISVVPGGTIDAMNTALTALSLPGIGLNVDYTPVAQTRTQLATGSFSQLTGQLKFISDNPYGDNADVLLPSVSLSPSGDLPFVGDDIATMTFDIGINTLDSNTSAIYIDGRPQ